jgi:alkyl sulfatase BDS1-like metallo-beta-lactamase superfamily hydrolase
MYPYWLNSRCEVNKAHPNWDKNIQRCGSIATQEECDEIPKKCWWRDTHSQNYLGYGLNLSYAPVIRQLAAGIYDVASQTGGVGRLQMVVLQTGIVLYDCMDSVTEATLAKEAMRAIVGNVVDTVLAIVYSHSHVDHFLGCPGWVIQAQLWPNGPVKIYAHAAFAQSLQAELSVAPIITVRTAQQLGNYLEVSANGALYPLLEYVPSTNFYIPTDWVSPLAPTTVIIGNTPFVIMPLPGDQDSNVALWLPNSRVAFISSIYYRNQPFVGTVRGGAPRSIDKWITSIQTIKNLAPIAVGTSHSYPMIGEQAIATELQWVINHLTDIKTFVLSRINLGQHPRDIAYELEQRSDFLRGVTGVTPFEIYGYPYAAAMGMFINSIGWYSGSIEELEPVNRTTEAIRFGELVGFDHIVSTARHTLKNAESVDDLRWGLQLSTLAIRVGQVEEEDVSEAQWLASVACERLGYIQVNLVKRHVYLTAASQFEQAII